MQHLPSAAELALTQFMHLQVSGVVQGAALALHPAATQAMGTSRKFSFLLASGHVQVRS
jgi:hypothetical protein